MFKFYELVSNYRFEDKKLKNWWMFCQSWELYFYRWYHLYTEYEIVSRWNHNIEYTEAKE